jgi:type I restriction enzyme S subunit
VWRGDIENKRWDVTFNLIQRSEARTSRFEFVPLRDLVSISSGGTPNKSKPDFWNGDIPWVSPKDFGPHVIVDSEDHITEKGRVAAGLHLIPAKSVLMVVRSGVLKHLLPVALTGSELTINQDLKALVPRKELMPEFLADFFAVFGKEILPAICKHSYDSAKPKYTAA